MNLKFLILSITAVAATSNKHHLRHKPGQHDISFRATKGRLHRLLNDNEVAPNRHLEALRVLRGSQRSLKDIDCEEGGFEWTCDKDTQECGKDQGECEEVCDEDKDCNGNGVCDDGECKCNDGFEEKDDCSVQDVEYDVTLHLTGTEELRTIECIEALQSLEQSIDDLDLPSTVEVDSKSNRSKTSESGAMVIPLDIFPSHDCTLDGLTDQALSGAELISSGRLVDGDGDQEPQEPLPASYECLVDESEDILKDAEEEKDADDLERDLNALLSECNVVENVSCVEECHHDIEDDCKDELDEEDKDDCGGLHNDLEKCYEKCHRH